MPLLPAPKPTFAPLASVTTRVSCSLALLALMAEAPALPF
jgi:hypothetical protein